MGRKGGNRDGRGRNGHWRGSTCFELAEGSKRCRHYMEGGRCALESEFRCVEWLLKNGHVQLAEELIARQQAQRQGSAIGTTPTPPAEQAPRPTDVTSPQRLRMNTPPM